jgi:hypothetical protein
MPFEIEEPVTTIEKEEKQEEVKSFLNKLSTEDLKELNTYIISLVKSKANKDDPALDRTHVMKFLFDNSNSYAEAGDYLNMRGDIPGQSTNKLILLLRVLKQECKLPLGEYFANQQLATSISWRRKGRGEGVEWSRTNQINQYGNGRDPLTPSGERNMSANDGMTSNTRKRRFF